MHGASETVSMQWKSFNSNNKKCAPQCRDATIFKLGNGDFKQVYHRVGPGRGIVRYYTTFRTRISLSHCKSPEFELSWTHEMYFTRQYLAEGLAI